MTFPLIRTDERRWPRGYRGLVVTCDVDKTYLDTDFESLAGLARVPLEWAEDKKTVPGMAPLLRELRHGPDEANRQTPFYFLTASPPQLTRQLFRKTLIDGVQADGVTCKDWPTILLKHRRPSWLGRQIAYKLCALLHQRAALPARAREILIGDNVESDAEAYALYADLAADRLDRHELSAILARHECDAKECGFVLDAFAALPVKGDVVENIYILMAKDQPIKEFANFAPELVVCRDPFQLAVHLCLTGRVRESAIAAVAADLVERLKASPEALAGDLEDGVFRSLWTAAKIRPLHDRLAESGLVAPPPRRYPTAHRRRHPHPGRWYPHVVG